jgi:hypothetical protein
MRVTKEDAWKINNARTIGFHNGKELSMADINGNTDIVSENPQEDSILDKAHRAWFEWARDNNFNTLNTQLETFKLMGNAFVDGYLSGFTKRFTEGE